jgi:hypothetical protein
LIVNRISSFTHFHTAHSSACLQNRRSFRQSRLSGLLQKAVNCSMISQELDKERVQLKTVLCWLAGYIIILTLFCTLIVYLASY